MFVAEAQASVQRELPKPISSTSRGLSDLTRSSASAATRFADILNFEDKLET
jgi:hypothetical protein